MTDRTAHEADFHARARASRDALEARDEDVSRTWQRGTDADVTVEVGPHTVTVDGVMLECTCGFRDMAGELSVRNHAATHTPAARIEVARRHPKPTPPSLDGLFVAPDGDDRPTIWHETHPGDDFPVAVLAKPGPRDPQRWLWGLVTGLLPERA